MFNFIKRYLILIAAAAVIVVLGISSYYFYSQYQTTQKLLSDPTAAGRAETKALVQKIGSFMELPQNEQPTVATVLDASKIKDQPFFAQAQNGDKVLLYTSAKKAILFRPSQNKIIEVGPINIGNQAATQTSSSIKVALYNGSNTVGLTNTLEKNLQTKYTNTEVVLKEEAKKNYDKTLVIDLSGNKNEVAAALARDLNGTVSSLPGGETKPASSSGPIDILIIVGNNFPR